MIKKIENKWGLNFTRLSWLCIRDAVNRINAKYTVVAFDIETTGLDPVNGSVLGFGLCVEEGKASYFDLTSLTEAEVKLVLLELAKLKVKVLIQNSLFDIPFLGIRYGVDLSNLDIVDTLIIEHTVNTHKQYYEQSLGLKTLALEYTQYGDYESELEVWKKAYMKEHKMKKENFSYGYIPTDILEPYCCMDVVVTFKVFTEQVKQIETHIRRGWTELPWVIRVKHDANLEYIRCKIRGIEIDRERLKEIGKEWNEERDGILAQLRVIPEVMFAERVIRREALVKKQYTLKNRMKLSQCRKVWKDNTFNFSSTTHKRILFFDVLKLKPRGKTSTGFSTDAEFVSFYRDTHVVCALLDDYSKLTKGITSFYDNLMNMTRDDYAKVHPTMSVAGTVSSRTSSKEPNTAQIPSKPPLNKIKDVFKAGDGYNWIAFDYVNEESVLLASYSGEESMLDTFNKKLDAHSMTALKAFGDKMVIPSELGLKERLEHVKENYGKTWRHKAKILGFSLSYGVTAHGLKDLLKCSLSEAQEAIDGYFTGHPKVEKFLGENKDTVTKIGFIQNRYGARIYLPTAKGYNWRDPSRKNSYAIKALKFCSNWYIQSAGAFILYKCMREFMQEVRDRGMDISLLMTVYDSFMVRVAKHIDPKEVAGMFRKHFTQDLGNVVLSTDAFMSPSGSWGDYEEISLNV